MTAWWDERKGGFPLSAADVSRLRMDATKLYEAAVFSASVHKEQGLYDHSERMAANRLDAAIAKAEGK